MALEINERLALALKSLQKLQKKSSAITSSSLERHEYELLKKQGFITPVIDGWNIVSKPGDLGSTTTWYASIKDFVADYCETSYGKDWHLSPEQSLDAHVDNPRIPSQINIRTKAATNRTVELLHKTSLLLVQTPNWTPSGEVTQIGRMRALKLEAALSSVTANYFRTSRDNAILALSLIKDPSDLVSYLLKNNKPIVAGRLAGAYAAIGREDITNAIIGAFEMSALRVTPSNPFDAEIPPLGISWTESPYVQRIQLMWQAMRQDVIEIFGEAPEIVENDIEEILKSIEKRYTEDAYNSLSIEGYKVTDDLIEKVRTGNWNPEDNIEDRKDMNLMAANGYYQAHNAVKDSIVAIIEGKNPGQVIREDLVKWYQALFSPFVRSGISKPQNYVGYRNNPVYIRGANHVPLNVEAVRQTMPALFELIAKESHPAVRAVLGHFIFVYIHPYMDGNGRTGRFLMNAMFVSGGYPWTVVRVETKNSYMSALNEASGKGDIKDFANHIKNEMDAYIPKPTNRPG